MGGLYTHNDYDQCRRRGCPVVEYENGLWRCPNATDQAFALYSLAKLARWKAAHAEAAVPVKVAA